MTRARPLSAAQSTYYLQPLLRLPLAEPISDGQSNRQESEPIRERHFDRDRLLRSGLVGGEDHPVLAVFPLDVRAWNRKHCRGVVVAAGSAWSARLLLG